jgi:hypothetical protein
VELYISLPFTGPAIAIQQSIAYVPHIALTSNKIRGSLSRQGPYQIYEQEV